MFKPIFVYIFLVFALMMSCSEKKQNVSFCTSHNQLRLVDSLASEETKNLYFNLLKLQGHAILFGQQNALANGVGWHNDGWRCDVYDVCGSYPAVFGWELSEINDKTTIDTLSFDKISNWISSVYEMGGINVVSWHFNPNMIHASYRYTIGDLYNAGPINKEYKRQLINLSHYLNNLNSKEGVAIPVFLRLFPESKMLNSGLVFQQSDSSDFVNLWKYSVTYIKDSCNVHNALYLYSTREFIDKSQYISFFPGQNWVDVIGLNNYCDFSYDETIGRGIHQLANLTSFAQSINKISALTETGQEGLHKRNWWTTSLLNPIKNDPLARNVSWIMTWKNTSKDSYFTPFPYSSSVRDFIQFESDSTTYFVDDLNAIYR